jgi:Cu2+-exporting ATPase
MVLEGKESGRMKKAILEVGGMLSVLDFLGVEKRLKRVPGVQAATVNIATNTAMVEYDETITDVGALRAQIIYCGFYCGGQVLPKHVCEPRDAQDAKETTFR